MRVLILGGTGAMGIHLVDNLIHNDIETFVTTRSYRASGKNLHYIQGNAKDLIFLERILDDHWDAVVDFMIYKTEEFRKRFNLFLDSTSQYFFLSSARVYANSHQPITENSTRLSDVSEDAEYLSTDEYALTKARQEDILINSGKSNWTIIRPYITYSEERLQLGVLEKEEWLYRALRGRTIIFSKEIASKLTTMTYGVDVSRAIMTLIGNQQAFGNIFHITTKECFTWEKIKDIYLAAIEENLGFRPKVLLQNMDKFLELHPSKYQIKYDRLFNRQFDNSKIGDIIDINSFTTIETGLKKCIKDIINNAKFKKINWKSEALKDKQTNEKTLLREIIGLKQKIIYLLYRYFPSKALDKLTNIVK